MKLQFIVNPASKTGRGIEIWKEVETVLKSSGIEYEVFFTKRIGHGTELAKKLTEGISEKQSDSREELTEEILKDEQEQFESLFQN